MPCNLIRSVGRFLPAVALTLLPSGSIVAQSVTAILTAANPAAVYASWPSTPAQFSLLINSSMPAGLGVESKVVLSLNGTEVGRGNGLISQINPGITNLNGTQFADWPSVEFIPAVRDAINNTGRLPAGNWRVCVEIRDIPGFVLLNPCASFVIQVGIFTATLVTVNVSSFPAQWASQPGQFILNTQNSIGAIAVHVVGRLLFNGAQVGTVSSPLESIGEGNHIFNGNQIADWSSLSLTGAVGNSVARIGRLPAGSYQLCLDFSDPAGGDFLRFQPFASCANFTVTPGTVTATLTAADVSAFPAEWASLPTQFTLLTQNSLGASLPSRVQGDVRLNSATVGTFSSALNQIPNGSGSFGATQFADWNSLQWTGQVAQSVSQTGRLPAGSYQLCLSLTDPESSSGGDPLYPPMAPCTSFSVTAVTVNLQLSALNVSRAVNNWGNLPTQFSLRVSSSLTQSIPVQLSGWLERDGVRVGTVPGNLTQLPASPIVYNSIQAFQWSQLALTGSTAAEVVASGNLPLGRYSLCAGLSSSGPSPLFEAVTSCAGFSFQLSGGLSASLSVPVANGVLGDWARSPTALQLVLNNSTGVELSVATRITLARNGQVQGSTAGQLTVISSLATSTYDATRIGQWEQWELSPALRDAMGNRGRLPTGTWTVCVEFNNLHVGDTQLSTAPACSDFTLIDLPRAIPEAVQPPRLVLPLNNSRVPTRFPSFQWTPVTTPASYRFILVEILRNQSLVQAIEANVPLLDTMLQGTTLTWPLQALALNNEVRYAWMVQAVDPKAATGLGIVPLGVNQGRSEVWSFQPGISREQTVVPVPGAAVPGQGPPGAVPQVPANPPTLYFNRNLGGKLLYSFRNEDILPPRRIAWPTSAGAVANPGKVYQQWAGQPWKALPEAGSRPGSERRPLGGVEVRLVVRYRGPTDAIHGKFFIDGKIRDDADKVIATAITAPDGSFHFAFHDDFPTEVVDTRGSRVEIGTGDLAGRLELSYLARYYNIEVANGHYLTPSDELVIGSESSADAGDLVSLVRSWNMAVKVTRASSGAAAPAMNVQVNRPRRPATVPDNEGTAPLPRTRGRLELGEEIAAGKSSLINRQSVVLFPRMVINVGGLDLYQITAQSSPGDPFRYKSGAAYATLPYSSLDPKYYNEQWVVPTDTVGVVVTPEPPRYYGTARDASTRQRLNEKAMATLWRNDSLVGIRLLGPRDSGNFIFDSLANGNRYQVVVYSAGFKADTFNIPALNEGAYIRRDHLLQPDAVVIGTVVNEAEVATYAPVVRMDNRAGQETRLGFRSQGSGGRAQEPGSPGSASPAGGQLPIKQWKLKQSDNYRAAEAVYSFSLKTPSGTHTLTVDAGPRYFPTVRPDLRVSPGVNDLGEVRVYRRMHRLRLRVIRRVGTISLPACEGTPVPGARVRVAVAGGPSGVTDDQGWVTLAWEANIDQTTLKIDGPADGDWIYQEPQYQIPESPQPVQRCARLQSGGRISGVVYVGSSDSLPVAGARVSLKGSGPLYQSLQAVTDARGHFMIRGVPAGTQTLRAAKSGSQFVGDSAVVNVAGGAQVDRNLHFTLYGGADLTRLLGFEMEVYSLTETGGNVRVGGALKPTAVGVIWDTQKSGQMLEFDTLTIKADSGSLGSVPVSGAVLLADDHLELRAFDNPDLMLRQSDPGRGLQVRDRGDGLGAVVGPVEVLLSSFSAITSAELSFLNRDNRPLTPWLIRRGVSGAERLRLPTVTADGTVLGEPQYGVASRDGNALPLRFFQFRADANPDSSALRADGLHLAAVLHTEIPGVNDLAIPLGDLHLIPGSGVGKGMVPPDGRHPLQARLQNWTLRANSWFTGAGQFRLMQGELRVPMVPAQEEPVTAFPFANMVLTPTTLSGGDFGQDSLVMAGIVPMQIPEGVGFSRDGDTGPWRLTARNTYFHSLPGMNEQALIRLSSVSFHSDGERVLSVANGTEVDYFNTARLTITGMGFDESRMAFIGGLDLLLPDIPPTGVDLGYTRVNDRLELSFGPLAWEPAELNGVKLRILSGQLDEKGFSGEAEIFLPDKFNVASHFTRTPWTGTNQASAVPRDDAVFGVGEFNLNQLSGGSFLRGGKWSTAWEGEVATQGELNGKVHIGVESATIAAGSAGLNVKDITTPFGNITVTINFAEKRYEGSLEFDGQISSTLSARGTAEFVFSGKPDDRFWYFFSGARFEVRNPETSGVAAMLVGNLTMPPDLLKRVEKYSSRPIPQSFHKLTGMLTDGRVTMPVPVCPSGGIDVGIARVGISCTVSGGLTFGLNWADAATLYLGTSAGLRVEVVGGVGLGLCVSVFGVVDARFDGSGMFRSDGAWYALARSDINVSAGAYAGVGIDDVCLNEKVSFTISLGAEAQVGHNFNNNTGPFVRIWVK